MQKPYPPLYIAVSTSPTSVEFAASRRIPIIVGGPTDVMGQAPQVVKLWHDKMEALGHEHAHIDLPVASRVYVAPTMDEAQGDIRGLEDFHSRVMSSIGTTGAPVGMPTDRDGNLPPGYEFWANRQRDRDRSAEPGHTVMPPLIGTPEVVSERLALIEQRGIRRVFAQFGFPGVPHAKVMRALELFGTQVMPHFRAQTASVAG